MDGRGVTLSIFIVKEGTKTKKLVGNMSDLISCSFYIITFSNFQMNAYLLDLSESFSRIIY